MPCAAGPCPVLPQCGRPPEGAPHTCAVEKVRRVDLTSHPDPTGWAKQVRVKAPQARYPPLMSGGRHGHSHAAPDRSALSSNQGIRAIKVSTFGLALTALIQLVIVSIGGSVGLLADSLHNLGDVFTTVALWVAFTASRRAADRRYTFGYERFEDLVGVVIVIIIAASGVLAGYESYRALIRPRHIEALGLSIAAGVVGILGNEAVAQYKVRVGRNIRSVALVADGLHSRTDGLVSGGAVIGLIGVVLGYPRADPIAGLVITGAILWTMGVTTREVAGRLADKVDPGLVDAIERHARSIDGVEDVHHVRARWAGRSLYVQLELGVGEQRALRQAHAIGEEVRHRVLHEIEGVSQVIVHLDPWCEGKHHGVYHTTTAHHAAGGEHHHGDRGDQHDAHVGTDSEGRGSSAAGPPPA